MPRKKSKFLSINGTQQVDDPRRRSAAFLDLAAGLGLGVAAKIKISEVVLE